MKTLLSLIAFISFFSFITPSFGQKEINIPYAEHYEGGKDSLLADIHNMLIYPPGAKRNRIQGTALVSIVMDDNAEYKEVKIIRRVGSGCDQEAIRIVKELRNTGKLKSPGYTATYVIPVKFKL